jgi:hypothetical protein
MYNSRFTPPPTYQESSDTSASEKPSQYPQQFGNQYKIFPPGKWRDLWAAVLFYIHFALIIALFGYSLYYLNLHEFTVFWDMPKWSDMPQMVVPFSTVVASILMSSLLAVVVLRLALAAPEGMIKAAFIGNIVASIVFCTALAVSGLRWMALMGLPVALLAIILFFLYRRHIPLSAVILKTVVEVMFEYPALINVSQLAVVGQVVHLVLLAVCSLGIAQMSSDGLSPQVLYMAGIGLVISLYWTMQVIQNVALTTTAGVFATFYFASTSLNQQVVNPTVRSFRRAMSWSFGSICFGSFIIAIFQLLRSLARNARKPNDLIGAIIDSLLEQIEDLMRYFNYYAYIYVAIYGKPYVASAKSVWRLLQKNGVLSIIDDNIIGVFCFMAALCISCTCATVAFVVARIFGEKIIAAAVTSYVTFFCSAIVCFLVLEILQSGATTTMVCLAEDPGTLARTKPELYGELANAYKSIFYNWQNP